MGCINGSEVARERGVTKLTHQKRDRSWDIWVGFLSRIDHHADPIWKPSTRLEDYASAALSYMQCNEVILGEHQPQQKSRDTLQERPSTMWRRP